MKRYTSLLVAFGALALSGCGEPPPDKAPSLASRVELAAGHVSIRQPGGAWQNAIAGQLLRHGAEVKVGAGDRALIRLEDGSAVFMRHGSEMELGKSGLRLTQGQIWLDTPAEDKEPARYQAGEVTVSASESGLDIRRTGDQVEVYVARGLAVVSAPGGRIEVQAGERATIKGQAAPVQEAVAFWEDWTGGMADRALRAGAGGQGTGRIYAIDRDRPGSPPQELEIRAQAVGVVVRDGVARTTVDQRFFNPGSTPVEGYYWFTLPEGAAVDRFALEVDSVLVDGEVVERKQAAAAYEAEIQQRLDPALLEWVDGRTFRARIFPIPPAGERRVVLSYLELLSAVDRTTHYVYPMGGATVRIQEFSLSVDLGDEGKSMLLATTSDARISQDRTKVTLRRSGFQPQGDFLLEMTAKQAKPLAAMRVESGRGEADFVMLRFAPDLDWASVQKVPGHVVVVVDTSAGGDDADRQLRADVAEAILRALSTSDRFALVAADLKPRVLYPEVGLAPADEATVGKALEKLSSVVRGGATDLGAVFDLALRRLHGAAQPALVYIGDGQPTVGERLGDRLTGRVARSMAGSAARLYTIAAGTRCDHALLERLARIGGGRAYRVDLPEQAVQEALRFVGSVKTPTITDLKLDLGAGLDQVFTSATGKVSRGEEVTVTARTHHDLPARAVVSGKLGGKPFSKEYPLSTVSGRQYGYVPRLWARRYLEQLMGAGVERNRGTIIRLGLDYSLMTPLTSFLVLESEAAYQRHGIQRTPRDPVWGQVPHAALDVAAGLALGVFGCGRGAAPEASLESTEAEPSFLRKSAPQASPPAPASPAAQDPSSGPAGQSFAGSRSGLAREAAPTVAKAMADKPMEAPSPSRGGKDEAPPADLSEDSRASADGEALAENEHRTGSERGLRDGASPAPLATCSDTSRRPLVDREAIWEAKLQRISTVEGFVALYRQAAAGCELPHWRDQRSLLDLIQARITSAAQVRTLLSLLPGQRAREFVRSRLLRRAVSSEMSSALDGGDPLDWSLADAALAKAGSAEERLTQIRTLCRENPTSRGCALRLVQALLAGNRAAEALALALRMRQDGLASPALMQQIGDMLATAGRTDEARRTYSEIVEFSPDDPAARRLLGDIYLRHGWHQEAYRQYRTLVEGTPNEALSQLRLAAAAAGSGRVDEGLRLERQVAAGEGEPGPNDPRRWARFWSAARIARLMQGLPTGKESLRQSMDRSLRRLQVLASPGVLVLLTWEDLQATLTLEAMEGDPGSSRGEAINAGSCGLFAWQMGLLASGSDQTFKISRSGADDRPVAYVITVLRWDGRILTHSSQKGLIRKEAVTPTLRMP